jgi:hypothetical protein
MNREAILFPFGTGARPALTMSSDTAMARLPERRALLWNLPIL